MATVDWSLSPPLTLSSNSSHWGPVQPTTRRTYFLQSLKYIVQLALTNQEAHVMWAHLDFEGVGVVRTWCEVCVHSGPATERPWVGAVVIQPETVPVTCSIWTARYSTWWRKGSQFSWKVLSLLHLVWNWSNGCQPLQAPHQTPSVAHSSELALTLFPTSLDTLLNPIPIPSHFELDDLS